MEKNNYQKVKSILDHALQIDPDKRDEYLVKVCEQDKTLLEHIKKLLQFENQTFLEQSAFETLNIDSPISEFEIPIPSEVKHYTIYKKLGAGGMGHVYAAKQQFPANRQVAIKLLKPATNQDQLIEECHSLARLNHPNIATLYEVGEWQDDLLYIAMELVEGEDIVNWCLNRNYSEQQTINLFQQLCSGISHAHERGIIHCDIKPSNILVTDTNGSPSIKIIDFGIALYEEKQASNHNSAGTPSYLSPEAMDPAHSLDIDTRRDVYALGVVLHKLLTKQLPNENEEIKAFKKLSKDLRIIINKSIASNRDLRYESAKEVSDELQRYIDRRVIEARSKDFWYASRRYVRRNLVLVLFSTALISSLLVGYVIQAQQANLADQRALEAEELSDFMVELFQISNPDQAQKNKTTVLQMIEVAKNKLLNLEEPKLSDAKFMYTLGAIYTRMDQLDDAQQLLEKSIEVKNSNLPKNHHSIIEAMTQLGVVYRRQNKANLSENILKSALDLQINSKPNPTNEAYIHNHLGNLYWQIDQHKPSVSHHLKAIELRKKAGNKVLLADSLNNLGAIYQNQKKLSESIELFEQAKDIYINHYGEQHPYVGGVLNNLASSKQNLFKFEEAESLYKQSYFITEVSYGPNHTQSIRTQRNLARFYESRRKFTEAIKLWELVINKQEKLQFYSQAANSYSYLARAHRGMNDIDTAIDLNVKAVEMIEANPSKDFRMQPRIMSRYATILQQIGEYDKAKNWVNNALEILKAHVKNDDFLRLYLLNILAQIYSEQGRFNEAETIFQQVIDLQNSSRLNRLQQITAHMGLSKVLSQMNKPEVAINELDKAEAINQSIFGLQHPVQATIWYEKGVILSETDRNSSLSNLNRALKLQKLILPPDHPDLLKTQSLLKLIE